jgi:hypothetical protein
MTDVSANTLIALVGLIVALIVNALAIFRYVAGTRDTLIEKIYAETTKADNKIDAVTRETRMLIDKALESESRSRQEFATAVTASFAEMRRDGKNLDDKMNLVQREMIRRSDIAEIRQEIMTAIDRQERNQTDTVDKMEKRFECLPRTFEPLETQNERSLPSAGRIGCCDRPQPLAGASRFCKGQVGGNSRGDPQGDTGLVLDR